MVTDIKQVIAAAQAGSAAMGGETFTELDKLVYAGALTVVRDGLGAFVEDEGLRDFLGMVLEAEIQAVPHMVPCACPGERVN